MSIKLDFSVLLRDEYPQWILKGVVTMFELTALAWLLAVAVGTVLAVIRMSNSRIGQALVATYVLFAAASMRIALRTREVQVPDLTNRSANEAMSPMKRSRESPPLH